MIVCKTPEEVLDQVRLWKIQGKRIGFVPTMGYLHEGHAYLFEECLSKMDKTVVSIFCKSRSIQRSGRLRQISGQYRRRFETL
ncbi:pantoate--beta-alanine ligase-like protein [Leptospira interrogans serovar Bataviae str. HAI135]|nr:pantoate--beta-alanine ligase-like protein [Leptospira interrogans serovar Bataviae str. HAI135]